jgi:hypothetical protein
VCLWVGVRLGSFSSRSPTDPRRLLNFPTSAHLGRAEKRRQVPRSQRLRGACVRPPSEGHRAKAPSPGWGGKRALLHGCALALVVGGKALISRTDLQTVPVPQAG